MHICLIHFRQFVRIRIHLLKMFKYNLRSIITSWDFRILASHTQCLGEHKFAMQNNSILTPVGPFQSICTQHLYTTTTKYKTTRVGFIFFFFLYSSFLYTHIHTYIICCLVCAVLFLCFHKMCVTKTQARTMLMKTHIPYHTTTTPTQAKKRVLLI